MKKTLLIIPLIASAVYAQDLREATVKQATIIVKDEAAYSALPSRDYLKEKMSYDAVKKEVAFAYNETRLTIPTWVLVHDKKRVISMQYTKGKVMTVYEIYDGTYDDCLKQIATLGLEFDDEQKQMATAEYSRISAKK